MPLPLVVLIYKNGLRPSTATLQNTAGDRAITNGQCVGIAIGVIIYATIYMHYRIYAVFQLACDEGVKVIGVNGFIHLFIGDVLKLHIGHVVEVDMQVVICVIGRVNDLAIRIYFGEGVGVCVLVMHILVERLICQQNIIHAVGLGKRLQFGGVIRHHGIEDFFVASVIVGNLCKGVGVSFFGLVSECIRKPCYILHRHGVILVPERTERGSELRFGRLAASLEP